MAYGYRRRANTNTTYGRRVTRSVNRAGRDTNGTAAIVSITFDLIGSLFSLVAWPFKKVFGLIKPEVEPPNEPIINMDLKALLQRDHYMDKAQQLRAVIDANDPSINWRNVTFVISGATGAIHVQADDNVQGAKIKAAYPN